MDRNTYIDDASAGVSVSQTLKNHKAHLSRIFFRLGRFAKEQAVLTIATVAMIITCFIPKLFDYLFFLIKNFFIKWFHLIN